MSGLEKQAVSIPHAEASVGAQLPAHTQYSTFVVAAFGSELHPRLHCQAQSSPSNCYDEKHKLLSRSCKHPLTCSLLRNKPESHESVICIQSCQQLLRPAATGLAWVMRHSNESFPGQPGNICSFACMGEGRQFI